MHSFYLPPAHLDLVLVSGPDTVRFLQGQLTCDVEALTDSSFTHGAACNNKGRVFATFVLVRYKDVCYLVFSKGLGESFANALKKFLPFYKCTLQLVPSQGLCIGSVGKDAEAVLATCMERLPEEGSVGALPEGWVCKLNEQYSQYLLCPGSAQVPDMLTSLSAAVPQDDLDAWQLAGMLSGHFPLSPEDSEKYTPQELNLEPHGYISFSKGCYTGQEIVARMHYRGKVKKQLYLLFSSTYTPDMLASGFDICDPDGNVVSRTLKQVPAGEGTLASLAQLPLDAAERYQTLFDSAGKPLDFRPF